MNMNFTKTVTKVNWVKLALTIVVIGVAGWLLTFLLLKGISMVKNKILEGKLVDRANAEIKDGDVTLTPDSSPMYRGHSVSCLSYSPDIDKFGCILLSQLIKSFNHISCSAVV